MSHLPMPKHPETPSKRNAFAAVSFLVLGVGCGCLLFRSWIRSARITNLQTVVETSVEDQNWERAFLSLYKLLEMSPDDSTYVKGLSEILPHVTQLDPLNVNSDLVIAITRFMALQRSWDDLAQYLDQNISLVPKGDFWMGSDDHFPDEAPRRLIYVDAFLMDRFEVTNAQYARFLDDSHQHGPMYWSEQTFPDGYGDQPVVGVSWKQADAYCAWAGKRLPTEAEWEKACVGDPPRSYPWGEYWDPRKANVGFENEGNWPLRLDDAWMWLASSPDGNPRLMRVGSYPSGRSSYGIHDLVGNASEWVVDWYNWEGYCTLPTENPIGTSPPWNHVLRGSAWFDRIGQSDLVPTLSRCSARNSSHSADDPRVGFRCVQSWP